jgi:hypothetical protein
MPNILTSSGNDHCDTIDFHAYAARFIGRVCE